VFSFCSVNGRLFNDIKTDITSYQSNSRSETHDMQAGSSDELIADFYAAAAGRVAWQQPLDRLVTQLGLWVVQIIGVDKRTGAAIFSAESSSSSPIVILDYLRYYQTSDPRVALTMATPDGQWMHCHEHLPGSYVANNGFYQDFLIPHGGRYLSSTKLVDNDEAVFMVGLMRGNGAEPLSSAESAILSLVQYHLSQAMQIFLHLRTGFADQAMARQLLGQFNQPMLLLDDAQRVLHSNQTASELLSEKDLLSAKNGFLVCRDKASHEALAEAVRAVLSASPDITKGALGTDDQTINVRQRRAVNLAGSAGKNLLAFVSAVWPSQSMNAFGDLPRALVILHNPQLPQSQLDPLILAECYDLTPAEARVAVQIASGATVKKIAQRNGVAIATVRTHLSRIMEKTSVTRQADLLRVLLTLPLRQVRLVGR